MNFEANFFVMILAQGLGITIPVAALAMQSGSPLLVQNLWIPVTVFVSSIGAIVYSTIKITRFVDRVTRHLDKVESENHPHE